MGGRPGVKSRDPMKETHNLIMDKNKPSTTGNDHTRYFYSYLNNNQPLVWLQEDWNIRKNRWKNVRVSRSNVTYHYSLTWKYVSFKQKIVYGKYKRNLNDDKRKNG